MIKMYWFGTVLFCKHNNIIDIYFNITIIIILYVNVTFVDNILTVTLLLVVIFYITLLNT